MLLCCVGVVYMRAHARAFVCVFLCVGFILKIAFKSHCTGIIKMSKCLVTHHPMAKYSKNIKFQKFYLENKGQEHWQSDWNFTTQATGNFQHALLANICGFMSNSFGVMQNKFLNSADLKQFAKGTFGQFNLKMKVIDIDIWL